MAKFVCQFNRTASTTLAVGSIGADATRPRRGKVYELILGSEATPADNSFLWLVDRVSALGTSTGITPTPLDPGDAATEADAGENHTVDPTGTTNLMAVPLNQRATFRWQAGTGGELIYAATAAAGICLRTPTSTAVAVTATLYFEEQ